MSGQFCVDANIFLASWYNSYPPCIFQSLWDQLLNCRSHIILIKPIFDELEPISPSDNKLSKERKREKYPLRIWLEDNNFEPININDEVNAFSLELEREYETSSISKGAGQNDITLIAYAKITNKTVVTFEGDQRQPPGKKSNYKIPLICREQNVDCIRFIEMLCQLNIKV